MDNRLQVVDFHDCLRGFVKRRGCGTAGIEAKLIQQLAALKQTPLYVIFIDLKKAYAAMDQVRYVEIMHGYGIGPNILRLIMFFSGITQCWCAGHRADTAQSSKPTAG